MGCINLHGAIAHELGHLCGIGPDTQNYDNYIEARNIGYACDDDPSTVDW
jgi:hypothetical protein